jgi:hypothetical protein
MPMFNSRVRLRSLQQALAKEARWRRPSPVTGASAAGSATATPATALDSAPASMPDGPLRLTDDQLVAVLRAAEPLSGRRPGCLPAGRRRGPTRPRARRRSGVQDGRTGAAARLRPANPVGASAMGTVIPPFRFAELFELAWRSARR